MIKDKRPKNCRKESTSDLPKRKTKIYIPPAPTHGMTDGESMFDPLYNHCILHPPKEEDQGYRGSAYEITKRKPVK